MFKKSMLVVSFAASLSVVGGDFVFAGKLNEAKNNIGTCKVTDKECNEVKDKVEDAFAAGLLPCMDQKNQCLKINKHEEIGNTCQEDYEKCSAEL